jgi:tape measure domain-containing protein
MATEERIVLTAQLKDELSAPLTHVERRVEQSTRRMARESNRSGQTVTRGLQRVARTVGRTFTTAGRGLQRIAAATGTGWRRMFNGVSGGSNQAGAQVTSVWTRTGAFLTRTAEVIRTGFSRAFTALGNLASRAGQAVSRGFGIMVTAASKAGAAIARSIGGALKGLGAMSASAGNAVGGALTAAVGAVTLGAGAVGTKALTTGLDRAKVIQDSIASGKILLGSEKDAIKLINDLKEVVTGTPFNLPDFAKAGTDMIAFGIGADKVPGIMRAIGEASAGRGDAAVETARSLALNFAQMAAVGKVSMDDVLSMQIAGIDALGILGNYFGYASEDMQKMISEGTIPADKAIEILTDGIMNGTEGAAGSTRALTGSMAELRKTVSGSWGALKAGVAKMGAEFWTPLMPKLPVLFNALNKLTGVVGEKVFKPIGEFISKSGLIEKATIWVERLTKALSAPGENPFFAKLKQYAPQLAILAGILAGFLGMVLSRLPLIGGLFKFINVPLGILIALLSTSPALREALGNAFSAFARGLKTSADAMAPFLPQLKDLIDKFANGLATALNKAAPFLEKHAGLIAAIAGGFLLLAPVMGPATKIFGAIGKVFAFIGPHMGTILTALKFMLGPWGILIALLVTAVATSKPLQDALKDLWTKLTDLGKSLFDKTGPGFSLLTEKILPMAVDLFLQLAGILGQVLAAILPFVGQLFTQLVPILMQLVGAVLPPLLALIGSLVPVVMTLLQALVPLIPPIMQIVSGLLKLIVDVLTPLIPVIGFVATVIAVVLIGAINLLVPVLTWLIGILVQIVTYIAGELTNSFNWWSNLVKNATAIIQKVFENLANFWRTDFQPLLDQVGKWFSDVLGGAMQGLHPVTDGLQDKFRQFGNWWTSNMQPTIDIIAAGFQAITDAIKPATDALGQFMGNPLGGMMDALGIKKDANGNAMSGGGVVGRAAGGAVLPGYSPGVDNIPYMLSAGESVLVPELTRQIGPENIMAANYEASHGRPAGDGPMRKAGGGGSTITVADGAIRLAFHGNADYAEVKRAARDALNEVLERQKRKY